MGPRFLKQELLHTPPAADRGRSPILFVHGAYCAAWIWAEHFIPFFASQGYAAYAVSLRGHGGSEGDLASASFNDYVEDVEAAVRSLPEAPIIIGHSMGGLIGQHHVSRGGAARALVALSSAPPSGLRASALHMTMFAPDVLFQLALLQSLGPEMASPAVIARALFSSKSAPETRAQIVKKLQRESPRASAELFAPPPLVRLPDADRVPVLSLGGDADVFLPRSAFQEIADFWQGDLEVLQGAPHALMLDTAWRDIAASRILAWLGKIFDA